MTKIVSAPHRLKASGFQFSWLCLICVFVMSFGMVTTQKVQAAGLPGSPSGVTLLRAGRIEYRKFYSSSLKRDVSCAVSLPPSYDRDKERHYPVVIFLHGLFNDEHDWETRGIEAKLTALREAGKVGDYIVAIPNGENSFYLNGKDGTLYEDAIVKDFIPFVDHTYRTLGTQRGRVIEGISMGGYGALVIAFKHPELFTAVVTHCAALFEDLPQPPASASDMRGKYRFEMASKVYGAPYDLDFFQANNPLNLAKTNAAKLKNLKIYFDVGAEDRYGFDSGNKLLHKTLLDVGVKHDFNLTPGGHGWSYLLGRSEEAFTFCWNAVRPGNG